MKPKVILLLLIFFLTACSNTNISETPSTESTIGDTEKTSENSSYTNPDSEKRYPEFSGAELSEKALSLSTVNNKPNFPKSFCFNDGMVYFANPNDNYVLYSYDGKNAERLTDITAFDLNYYNGSVYFLSSNSMQLKDRVGKVFRYDAESGETERITDSEGCNLIVNERGIFYSNNNYEDTFYVYETDPSSGEEKRLHQGKIAYFLDDYAVTREQSADGEKWDYFLQNKEEKICFLTDADIAYDFIHEGVYYYRDNSRGMFSLDLRTGEQKKILANDDLTFINGEMLLSKRDVGGGIFRETDGERERIYIDGTDIYGQGVFSEFSAERSYKINYIYSDNETLYASVSPYILHAPTYFAKLRIGKGVGGYKEIIYVTVIGKKGIRMKKIICACLLSALALTVCSCSSPPSETERIYNEERVEYDIEDSFRMNLYGGKVYAVSMSGYENAEDEQVEGETVYVFDENGKKFDKLTLKGAYVSHCWDIADGRIYSVGDMSYSSEENGGFVSRRILYSSDIETGDTVEVCDFEGIAHVYKIAAVGDRLYWLGQSEEFRPFSEMLYPNEGGYVNCSENGNVFGCIDISTGVCTEINISHPVAFSERNGRIVIYAYEEDKGYYFYDNEAEKVICYTNKLGQLSDFDIINDNNDFVFKDYDGSFGDSLAFSGMDGESGVIQLDDGLWPSQFSSEGDYLCVQAAPTMTAMGSNEKIYKYMINISTADPPLRVITASDIIKQDPLFSCGFQIKTDSLTQESFSLTVLSLDKDYDMAMMSSSESYSAEIKDKGSFYPLNDIPGVEEYINRCFPSIKEAAADKNGDIWMLPISVDIPVLIYNEENCADKGIFFSSELDGF